jgi:hypothetical protein
MPYIGKEDICRRKDVKFDKGVKHPVQRAEQTKKREAMRPTSTMGAPKEKLAGGWRDPWRMQQFSAEP